MKKKAYLGLVSILCCICMTCICVSATEGTVYNWYCVRNSNHLQPIADANMRFIEEYDGYYIDHAHGDGSEDKVLYLTFDAGYENGNVDKILNILSEEQVPGAFFILGNLINRNPDLIRRMVQDGHTVCNHTNHHPDMTTKKTLDDFKEELISLEELYRQATGMELAKYYRPPEGKFDKTSLKYARQLGYQTIFWSLAYADWDNSKQPSPESAKKKILDNIHNGAVILLHPTSATNAIILKEVIQTLKGQGYRFGTLDELTGKNTIQQS
ncbi:MAG: polysaccharide deacetylase family protein [Clostridia bacterium]|nr:polysaccharide deacetylase family protein [Clostridia bacterium]